MPASNEINIYENAFIRIADAEAGWVPLNYKFATLTMSSLIVNTTTTGEENIARRGETYAAS